MNNRIPMAFAIVLFICNTLWSIEAIPLKLHVNMNDLHYWIGLDINGKSNQIESTQRFSNTKKIGGETKGDSVVISLSIAPDSLKLKRKELHINVDRKQKGMIVFREIEIDNLLDTLTVNVDSISEDDTISFKKSTILKVFPGKHTTTIFDSKSNKSIKFSWDTTNIDTAISGFEVSTDNNKDFDTLFYKYSLGINKKEMSILLKSKETIKLKTLAPIEVKDRVITRVTDSSKVIDSILINCSYSIVDPSYIEAMEAKDQVAKILKMVDDFESKADDDKIATVKLKSKKVKIYDKIPFKRYDKELRKKRIEKLEKAKKLKDKQNTLKNQDSIIIQALKSDLKPVKKDSLKVKQNSIKTLTSKVEVELKELKLDDLELIKIVNSNDELDLKKINKLLRKRDRQWRLKDKKSWEIKTLMNSHLGMVHDTLLIDSVKLVITKGQIQEFVVYGHDKSNKQQRVFQNRFIYSLSTIRDFNRVRTGTMAGKTNHFLREELRSRKRKETDVLMMEDVLELIRDSKLLERTYVPTDQNLTIKPDTLEFIKKRSSKISLDVRTYSDLLGFRESTPNSFLNIELYTTFIGVTKPFSKLSFLSQIRPFLKYTLVEKENILNKNTQTSSDLRDSISLCSFEAVKHKKLDLGLNATLLRYDMALHNLTFNADVGVMTGDLHIIKAISINDSNSLVHYDTTELKLYNPYVRLGALLHFNATENLSFDFGAGLMPYFRIVNDKDWSNLHVDFEEELVYDLLWQINFRNKTSTDFFLRTKYIGKNNDKGEEAFLKLELGASTTLNKFFSFFVKK